MPIEHGDKQGSAVSHLYRMITASDRRLCWEKATVSCHNRLISNEPMQFKTCLLSERISDANLFHSTLPYDSLRLNKYEQYKNELNMMFILAKFFEWSGPTMYV